jgi:hypothetical protein
MTATASTATVSSIGGTAALFINGVVSGIIYEGLEVKKSVIERQEYRYAPSCTTRFILKLN